MIAQQPSIHYQVGQSSSKYASPLCSLQLSFAFALAENYAIRMQLCTRRKRVNSQKIRQFWVKVSCTVSRVKKVHNCLQLITFAPLEHILTASYKLFFFSGFHIISAGKRASHTRKREARQTDPNINNTLEGETSSRSLIERIRLTIFCLFSVPTDVAFENETIWPSRVFANRLRYFSLR